MPPETGQPDLFGHRPPQVRRGRPRHVPTDLQRDRVRKLHAKGLDQLAIARAIGITAPTLRLNYHEELGSNSQAWRRRDAEEK